MAVWATACVSLYNSMSQGVCAPVSVCPNATALQCMHIPVFACSTICVSQCFCLSLCLCASAPVSCRLCVPVLSCYCVSLISASVCASVFISRFPCVSKVCVSQCVCPSWVLGVPLCIPVSVWTGNSVAVSGPIISVCQHLCVLWHLF